MTSIRRVIRGVRIAMKDTAARALLVFLFGLILWASAFYHFVEGWKWVDAIYFSVVTLSTVGYGDFSPETTAGKIFTVVFIIVGFDTPIRELILKVFRTWFPIVRDIILVVIG